MPAEKLCFKLTADCQLLRIYAETENAQGRCQALQEDRDRKSEAGTRETAPHPDLERNQDETEIQKVRIGERWRSRQSFADDSVSVRSIVESSINNASGA